MMAATMRPTTVGPTMTAMRRPIAIPAAWLYASAKALLKESPPACTTSAEAWSAVVEPTVGAALTCDPPHSAHGQ